MTDPDTPRVKLPESTPRKPVVPGPNSWAQQHQQQEHQKQHSRQPNDSKSTVRDKYEHKPMPLPPTEASPPQASFTLQPKAYIQPAIPLFNLPPSMQASKNRAVTDPVAPKPLFTTRKVSVKELRKQFSNSKRKSESPQPDVDNPDSPSLPTHITSGKAAQILGLYPVANNNRDTTPFSAPATSAPDTFRSSTEGSLERAATPSRQVQSTPVPARSTPVPTRRYLEENGLPDPTPTEIISITRHQTPSQAPNYPHDIDRAGMCTPANGFLRPPKVGIHSNVGEVGLVDGPGMHRVESFRGVIEDTADPYSGTEQSHSISDVNMSQPSTAEGQNSARSWAPDAYTPSNYTGVWENDPAVGYSLPPFSPMPKQTPQDPSFPRNPAPSYGPNNFLNYQQPLPSANSWAAESNANSYMSTAPPSAQLPPPWPHHLHNNSVPSPPHNRYDFERSNSIPAAMAQIELTLHHHLDGSFHFLSRLITDKHDRTMDRTIRRLDDMDDMINKSFRDVKSEIGEIKKQVGSLQGDVKDLKKRNDRTVDLIKGFDGKFQALDKKLEDQACRCHYDTPQPSSSEPESDRHPTRSDTSSLRRTESARATTAPSEPRSHRRGLSRVSNRMSGASSKRAQSVAVNDTARVSEDRGTRSEYLANMAAARGPVPDLREHPAYAGMPQAHGHGYGDDQVGLGLGFGGFQFDGQNQGIGDVSWYQQAYGQGN